jgi:hypothetical protein
MVNVVDLATKNFTDDERTMKSTLQLIILCLQLRLPKLFVPWLGSLSLDLTLCSGVLARGPIS